MAADSALGPPALAKAWTALERGDGPAAVRSALTTIAVTPDAPDAYFILGLVAHPHWFTRALALAPDHLGAAVHLSQALNDAGASSFALRVLRRSVAVVPSRPPSLVNLALIAGGEEARRWLLRATSVAPDDGMVRLNLGAVFDKLGLVSAAAIEHRRAAALLPGAAQAAVNLALARAAAGDFAGAGPWHRRALAREPLQADALAGLGAVARAKGRSIEGRGWDRRAAVLRPWHAPTLANLCHGDFFTGEARRSLAWSRRAEAADPFSPNYATAAILNYLPGIAPSEVFERQRRWVSRHVASERPLPARRVRGAAPLKVGILSADLGNHPVGWNIVGLFDHHRRVELHAYAGDRLDDVMAARFKASATRWTVIDGLSDDEIATRMRGDGIDLLVVLAGQTAGNRLLVAAHGAAPVQASYLDLSSSGLATMNWWIGDAVTNPEETEERFTERQWRLPSTFCRPAPDDAPDVAASPAEASGVVTFASFNHPAKVTPEVVRLWAQILRAVPRSRLLIKYGASFVEPAARRRYVDLFDEAGVAPDRLDFATERLDRQAHLALFSGIDIALDPFPFNGCTTTFEALWMGVPVVALQGDRFIARMGASILSVLGRHDLVAADPAAYVAMAVALAEDRARLAAMRGGLRDAVARSRLCDMPAFAASLEDAFLAMTS